MHCPHCGGWIEEADELLASSKPVVACTRCGCAWTAGRLVIVGLDCPIHATPATPAELALLRRVDASNGERDWTNEEMIQLMGLRGRNLVVGFRLQRWYITDRGRDVVAAADFISEKAKDS